MSAVVVVAVAAGVVVAFVAVVVGSRWYGLVLGFDLRKLSASFGELAWFAFVCRNQSPLKT